MIPLSQSNIGEPKDQITESIREEIEEFGSVLLNSTVLATVSDTLDHEFVGVVYDHANKRQEDQTVLFVDDGSSDMLEQFAAKFPAIHQQEIIAGAKLLQPFGASLSFGIDESGNVEVAAFMAGGVNRIEQVWSSAIFRLFYKSATRKESLYLSLKDRLEDYESVLAGKDNVSEWRGALKASGVEKRTGRDLLAAVSGLMLLGNTSSDEDFSEGCSLLGLQPAVERSDELIIALYNRLIAKFVTSVNESMDRVLSKSFTDGVGEVSALVSLVRLAWDDRASKQKVLNCTFDDEFILNSEMINEGLPVPRAPRGLNCRLAVEPDALAMDIPELEPDSTLYSMPQTPNSIDFSKLVTTSRVWTVLGIPLARLSQIATDWHFNEFVTRAGKLDFTTDYEIDEFFKRYYAELFGVDSQGLIQWAMDRGFGASEFAIGCERIWMSESCWRYLETKRNLGYSPMVRQDGFDDNDTDSNGTKRHVSQGGGYGSDYGEEKVVPVESVPKADGEFEYNAHQDVEKQPNRSQDSSKQIDHRRRFWLVIVWLFTWWLPSPVLWVLGLRDHATRTAWREKLAICMMIALINLTVIFYMVAFGKLICPDYDHAWTAKEVGFHQGDDDFYVAIHGKVYDMTRFYKTQHSDMSIKTTKDNMMQFAGQDVTNLFPKPLSVYCSGLVDSDAVWLESNSTVYFPQAIHYTGSYKASDPKSALNDINWYQNKLVPKLEEYYKGDLVVKKDDIKDKGKSGESLWAIVDEKIYDLTDYFHTLDVQENTAKKFFNEDFSDVFMNYAGEDVTDKLAELNLTRSEMINNMNCLKNAFLAGSPDFRDSIRCQFTNYMLLTIAVIVGVVVMTKFIAAFQYIGVKNSPPMQDRFVVCNVPVYSEGEEEIRRAVDSLTALKYPNHRKLLLIVCDGVVHGHGNSESTPSILLSILGHDFKRNEDSGRAYKAVGEGYSQLNTAQVYSGLYEFQGDLVPYLVVVKTGNELETSKPGNRGKRDSQLLTMNFFNRVHHQTPMSPLELEMFDQLNNTIGVDPERYEYIFMVDADTSVAPDSLNRLVSDCVSDSRIAGICGETRLQNEHESFWTMMQVYEYYISHHLTKAFESLFGSVTCLPGCFTMYRIKTTANVPLIISNSVIREYYLIGENTLHQQNLLSLGEDRFLTTLMMKHFPQQHYTFDPSALAYTTAPNKLSVLVSQRRRWINSTVHNLVELLRLNQDQLCGFCCFGMRFFVFVDLAGTILLPSVCIYLGYLLYVVTTKSGAFPLISVVTIGAVYGLQALIFIVKREWAHIGWLVFYILSYPVHSFILPLYSFWKQDDFSWGRTRKTSDAYDEQLLDAPEDREFDDQMVPKQLWTAYALVNGLPGAHRDEFHTKIEFQRLNRYDESLDRATNMQNLSQSTLGAEYDDDERIRALVLEYLKRQDLQLLTMNQVYRHVQKELCLLLDKHQKQLIETQVDKFLNT